MARNPLRLDPTRTTMLRRRFARAITRKLERLRRDVIALVVDEDAFGLRASKPPVFNQRFRFMSSSEQLRAFELWLRSRTDALHLTDDEAYERFIQEGYGKGAGRAFQDAKRATLVMQDVDPVTQEQMFRSAIGGPMSREKVKLIASRAFTAMRGVTEAMAAGMTRIMAEGLTRGENPRVIGRNLTKQIGITKRRAETIARTELIRAHAEGQLTALEMMGVQEVGVMVEWSAAGDDRTCPQCSSLNGIVLKIEEARGLIPVHPLCRCSWVPSTSLDKDRSKQKRSKREIDSSIGKAVKEETGAKTIKEAKRESRWAGADVEISKSRPEPVVNDPLESFSRHVLGVP